MADTKEFQKGVQGVEKESTTFKDKIKAVGGAIATAFAAKKIVDFAKDSINAAKDLNASMSRTKIIFGESADTVSRWGDEAASALRLSKADALTAANTFGKTLVGSFGLSEKASAEMSMSLVEMAADLAAFNRIPFDEAMQKVSAGMMGQTRGLKSMGISLTQTEVAAKAVELGLAKSAVNMGAVNVATQKVKTAQLAYNEAVKKSGKDSVAANKALTGVEQAQLSLDKAMAGGKVTMSDQAKAQATHALLLEKSELAAGANERAGKSLTGQQEKLRAEWENSKAAIGNALLPALTNLATVASDMLMPVIRWLGDLFKDMGPLILIVAMAFGSMMVAVKIATTIQTLFNVQLGISVGWIGVIVAVAVLLVAGIVYLATQTQFFQRIWQTVWNAAVTMIRSVKDTAVSIFNSVRDAIMVPYNWVKQYWPLLAAILLGPFGIALAFIYTFRDEIKAAVTAVINWVKDRFNDLVSFFTGLPARVGHAAGDMFHTVREAATAVANFVRDRVNDVVGFFAGLPGRIGGAMSGMANAISSGFRAGINAIIDLWNNTLGKIKFEIPGWVPGMGGKGFGFPTIPRMAMGGYVDRPTLALIGEAGPEYVIPASDMSHRGAVINIEHLEVRETLDVSVFMRRMAQEMQAQAV